MKSFFAFLLLPLLWLFLPTENQSESRAQNEWASPANPPEAPLVMCNPADRPLLGSSPAFVDLPNYRVGSADPKFVRRDVHRLAPDDPTILAYKKAVKVMKSREKTDPTSWFYQAAMHGTTETPRQPAWNSCTHGDEFFLSWHRMYLYFFERIVREASGDPNFSLPYWEWSVPKQRNLPPVFRASDDKGNPLFEPKRRPAINAGGDLGTAATRPILKLNLENEMFGDDSFRSAMEGSVHGQIHVNVGGLMGALATAAQDPIFWLHHCNVDHLWERYSRKSDAPYPTGDKVWMNTKFLFFDEKGGRVTMSGKDVVDIARQLDYRYDDLPVREKPVLDPPQPGKTQIPVLLFEKTGFSMDNDRTTFSMPIGGGNLGGTEKSRFVLVLGDISADVLPVGNFEIYFNLPDGTEPDPDGNFFAGTVNFFGVPIASQEPIGGQKPPANQRENVSEVVQFLKSKDPKTSEIKVTFFFRPFKENAGEKPAAIKIDKIRLQRRG